LCNRPTIQPRPPENPTPKFIEFTYYNDRLSIEVLKRETTKYQPFINNIAIQGWVVGPIIVLVARARATSHIPSMKSLETTLELPIPKNQEHI
jgi:hypothetical protein